MKLVLFCSTQLASFSQFLCYLYYVKAILNLLCFGEELEVQEKLERLLHGWACFRSCQGFPGRDKVSSPVSRHGS